MNSIKDMGDLITEYRTLMRLTREELAIDASVNINDIINLEEAKDVPLSVLIELLNFFDLTMEVQE